MNKSLNLKKILLLSLLFCISPLSFSQTLDLEYKDTTTFYIKGYLPSADIPTSFLFDTGSGYTALPGKPINGKYVKDLKGILATGETKIVEVYQIPYLKIGTCEIKDVEVAIFPTSTRAIIGNTTLQQLSPITIDYEKKQISFKDCE